MGCSPLKILKMRLMTYTAGFIRQFWFNTPPNLGRALAADQTMQRPQKFGIKPGHIINFLYELALR
jgi:hypothetical protein